MASGVLKAIENAIEDVVRGLRPKIAIKVPPFIDISLDTSELSSLKADRDALAITIETCFTRRRLYVARVEKEQLEYGLKSADEIRAKLDERAEELAGRGVDNRVLFHYILEWSGSTHRLIQVLRDREAELPSGAWIGNDRESAEALWQFRHETLPIIGLLIAQLEARTKDRAEKAYSDALKALSAREVEAVEEAIDVA